jgi:hypothetical protein
MAVRSFNGSTDYIQLTQPAYFSGPWTWVGVFKRASVGTWQTPFSIAKSNDSSLAFSYMDTNSAELGMNRVLGAYARETTHNPWGNTGAWRMIAVTFDDAVPHRFHETSDGSSWFQGPSNDAASATANPQDWTADSALNIGRWDNTFNYFDGLMAMQALHTSSGLSDAAVRALAGGNAASFAAAGFDHVWVFNQASTGTAVTDSVGSLNQTAISGTSVVTGNDPSTALFDVQSPVAVGRMRSRRMVF